MNPSRARRKRSLVCAVVVLIVTSSLATAAQALPLVGFNIRGGQYTDTNEAFLGGGVDVGLTMLTASPNFEWVFIDGGSLYTVNFDATYSMGLASAKVWWGGGYVLRTTDIDGFDSVTKGGINLLAGVGLGLVPLKPFVQLKYAYVSDEDEFIWMVGIRF